MNLKEYKTKKMNDPEFAGEYERIQSDMNMIRSMIDADGSLENETDTDTTSVELS